MSTHYECAACSPTRWRRPLDNPFDAAAYATDVANTGRMEAFDNDADPAATFLTALATALVAGTSDAPALLNAIEALAGAAPPGNDRTVTEIGLTLAVILADRLRKADRVTDADAVYRLAGGLADRADAAALRWRIRAARGECARRSGDDVAAAALFHQATVIIEQNWFAVLDEDKRQHFFADKAWLYDQAMLCQLRLGHPTVALEYLEKAKTRYLTDLMARRQFTARTSTDPEVTEAFRMLASARPTRVWVGSAVHPAARPVELLWTADDPSDSATVLRPRELMALETAASTDPNLRGRLGMLGLIWSLMPVLAADNSDAVRDPLTDINDVLAEAREATVAGQPPPPSERERLVARYEAAAAAYLPLQREREDARFSAFLEFGAGWVADLLRDPSDEGGRLVLAAVLEATNAVLHREAVYGVPADADPAVPRVRTAVAAAHATDAPGPGRTTIVDSAMSRLTRTHWHRWSRLARGETAGVPEALDAAPPGTALVEFAVTPYGTVTFLSSGASAPRPELFPQLAAWQPIEVGTTIEVTATTLASRLDGLLTAYGNRRTEEGFDRWTAELDGLLGWLTGALIEPLAQQLRNLPVTRLVIVPHRGLHLVPFAALGSPSSGAARRVLDDYDVCMLPSLTLRRVCRARVQTDRRGGAPMIVADPTGDLPLAAVEGARVAATLPGPPPPQLFTAAAARILQDADTDADAPHILHYAGHGRYDWSDPLRSELVLPDRPLTLDRLFTDAWPLRGTRLVTLSGCETAVVNHRDLADEYLSLASGFLFGGTPTVVSSLWVVDDLSAALLMTNFYQRLMSGGRPSAAMRQAQVWLRDEVDYPTAIGFVESALASADRASAVDVLHQILDDLRAGAGRDAGGRPFAHPCDWAAFTVSGLDEPLSPSDQHRVSRTAPTRT